MTVMTRRQAEAKLGRKLTSQEDLMRRVASALDERDLTGPHHVGAEIDLEYQTSHHMAWGKATSALLWGSIAASAVGICCRSDFAGGLGIGLIPAAIAASYLSQSVASKAITDGPKALLELVGPVGKWSPVTASGIPPTARRFLVRGV